MQKLALPAFALVSLFTLAETAAAQAVVGQTAPEFSVTDSSGRSRTLSELRGKVVVLEWWNPECPFVGKHYDSGNMQKLQKEWSAKGVVWLTVNSAAAGKQGFLDAARANAVVKEKGGAASSVLLDSDGRVGRAFGAKTTPHMFVIDPAGTVVYAGGIDDKPSADKGDVATARNFVSSALAEVTAGRKVTTPTSTPYGCGVKYGS
jgi:hypothetical protein